MLFSPSDCKKTKFGVHAQVSFFHRFFRHWASQLQSQISKELHPKPSKIDQKSINILINFLIEFLNSAGCCRRPLLSSSVLSSSVLCSSLLIRNHGRRFAPLNMCERKYLRGRVRACGLRLRLCRDQGFGETDSDTNTAVPTGDMDVCALATVGVQPYID